MAKKIFDPVHGFIHFNEIEGTLIDTESFQRLRYIHQLGISYLVYPGGTHTRFEHSLGTMHLASKIFDQVADEEARAFWRQIVRLAALCHDLGHLPFSHVAEHRLLGKAGHEEWTLKIIESKFLEPVWDLVEKEFSGFSARESVVKIALGEEKLKQLRPDIVFSPWERVYSQIIAGDFFGADRMDYLLRDAKSTGLSYGLFDYTHLIEMLVVVSEGEGLSIGIEENGIESCEALLLARHFMQRRVYQYPAAKAYSFHLARFMQRFYCDPAHFANVESYTAMNEPEVLCALQKAMRDPNDPGHLDAICLFNRKKRFSAIHLPEVVKGEELEAFRKKEGIGQTDIHWDLMPTSFLKRDFSLPILQKNAQIAPAHQFSELSIPKTQKNWLYLAPEYDFSL